MANIIVGMSMYGNRPAFEDDLCVHASHFLIKRAGLPMHHNQKGKDFIRLRLRLAVKVTTDFCKAFYDLASIYDPITVLIAESGTFEMVNSPLS